MVCNRWHSRYTPSLFLPQTRVASPGTPSMTYQELPKPPPYRLCVLALSNYTFALLAYACSAWAGEAPGMQPGPGSWLGHQWHRSAVTTHAFTHSTKSHTFDSCAQGLRLTWHMTPAQDMQSLRRCCAGEVDACRTQTTSRHLEFDAAFLVHSDSWLALSQ